jgi:scyllo-inositol 2-dehydrogenase (NADP+)
MSKINVGLVGFGLSGRVFQSPIITSVPGLHLKSVVERHKEESKAFYPWVEIVRDFEALLQDETIDLVVITPPNQFHFEMTQKALLAGKHVVVEKPFTNTSQEASELVELAKKQGKLLSVYQNRRWDGDFQTVRQVVESGWLGELKEVEIHYDRFRNELKPSAWREENKPGSGILFDLGSHLIDQAQTLFGTPDSVQADVRITRKGGQVDDYFDVVLQYGELKVILKSSSLVREEGPHYTVHGTRGSFVKYGMDSQENALKEGVMPSDISDWGIDPEEMWGILHTEMNGLVVRGQVETIRGDYRGYYQNIVDAIEGKADLAVTPEQARNTIRIIELAMQSSRERRELPFTLA